MIRRSRYLYVAAAVGLALLLPSLCAASEVAGRYVPPEGAAEPRYGTKDFYWQFTKAGDVITVFNNEVDKRGTWKDIGDNQIIMQMPIGSLIGKEYVCDYRVDGDTLHLSHCPFMGAYKRRLKSSYWK